MSLEGARPPFPFIVGVPRSGNTVLRLMLDSHPAMAIPPESYFPVTLWPWRRRYKRHGGFDLGLLAEDLLGTQRVPRAPFEWNLDPALVRKRLSGVAPLTYSNAIRLVYAMYAGAQGKPRYGDKTPAFVRDLPLLARLFPEARFIHLIRDGRDVALSVVEKRWGPKTLLEAATWWERLVDGARRAGRELGPKRYLEVGYEELVDDPQAELKGVCSFVDLNYSPAMLQYSENWADRLPEVERTSHDNLGRPLTRGLREWRRDMEARDVAAFEAIAGRVLADCGYERAFPRPPPGAVLRGLVGRLVYARGRARRALGRGYAWLRFHPDLSSRTPARPGTC